MDNSFDDLNGYRQENGEEDELPEGVCIRCNEITTNVCSRCGDFYCSAECQREDWHYHRYICFPIPPLLKKKGTKPRGGEITAVKKTSDECRKNGNVEKQAEVLKNVLKINTPKHVDAQELCTVASINTEENSNNMRMTLLSQKMIGNYCNIANNSTVLLCNFRSTNRCYIRPVSEELVDYFKNVTRMIAASGKTAPGLKSPIIDNSQAICHLKNHGVQRVIIEKFVNMNCIHVLFCDFGILKVVAANELRQIPIAVRNIPLLSFLVPLSKIPHKPFTDEITAYLSQYEMLRCKYELKDKNSSYVVLRSLNDDSNINEHIHNFLCEMDTKKPNVKSNKSDSISVTKTDGNNTIKSLPKFPVEIEANTSTIRKAPITASNEKRTSTASGQKNKGPAHSAYPKSSYEPPPSSSPPPTSSSSSSSSSSSVRMPLAKSCKDAMANTNVVRKRAAMAHSRKDEMNSEQRKETKKEEALQSIPLAPDRVMTTPFNCDHLCAGDVNLTVFVIDVSSLDSGFFGCLPLQDVNNLYLIQKTLNERKDNNIPYRPLVNEYCIAKFEDEWYRAKVVSKIDDDKYRVLYIDYTNECVINCDCIRPYPSNLKYDCKSNMCLIDELPPRLSDKQVTFLKTLIRVNKTLVIDKVLNIDDCKSIGDVGFAAVEVSSIIRRMQEEGLLSDQTP